MAGLFLSIESYLTDRKESAATTLQIQELEEKLEESNSKIVISLISKHKIESQVKDDLNKALVLAIGDLSRNQGNLGSKIQIETAMIALAKGNTVIAKQLFSYAAEKGEQEVQQTAKAYRHLGALAFLDNTQQAIQAYRRANELDPNNPSGWNQLGHLLKRVGELNKSYD